MSLEVCLLGLNHEWIRCIKLKDCSVFILLAISVVYGTYPIMTTLWLKFVTRFTLQNDTTATVNDPTEESSDNSSPAFSFLAGSATEFELLAQAGRFAQIPNRVQPVAPTNSIDWRQLGTTHSWNVIPRISSLSTSSILRFSLGLPFVTTQVVEAY